MRYVYVLTGEDREQELAAAEAAAVTGGSRCAERLVSRSDRRVDPARTGYLGPAIELLAHGPDLETTCSRLAEREVRSQDFAIEVRRIPRGLKVDRHETATRLGLFIEGTPDLGDPKERFLAIGTAEGLWFGRRVPAGEADWKRLVHKRHTCSSALPSQVARAVCNLVIRGGERVVDPCCGTGSLLAHAAALGARVTGFDINWKMVRATNQNLEHFGFDPAASQADAAEVAGAFDVTLANIPYGHMSPVSEETSHRIVRNIVGLAPRGAIVAVRDLSGDIREGGAEVRETIRLPKSHLIRRIFVYARPGAA